MKVFIAVSKKYVRPILNVVYMLKPRPKVLVISYDEEVEALSKYYGYEFKYLNDNLEQLSTIQELQEYDMAILAQDEDSKNVSILKAIKQFAIPIIIALLHNTNNRDLLINEGATYIINVDEFLYSNLYTLMYPDTWIEVSPIAALPKFRIATYRVLRRALFNIPVSEVLKIAKEYEPGIAVFCFSRFGNKMPDNSVLETGSYIVLAGFEENVEKTLKDIEKLFRKYEEVYARRYSDIIRLRKYG
ncbi:MAG: NAD-binding protein [Ignisphaera sp.]